MDRWKDYNMLDQGLKLVKKAAYILEGISNHPGVTPSEFYAALDSRGITDVEERSILMNAAATVELSLEFLTDTDPTVH
tara:strand:- start:200 stop:436 length:237 start_codon:yes stop_codon:yes gene_type:complete